MAPSFRRRMLDMLEEQLWEPRPGLEYRGPADFVRRHGTWYTPRPFPGQYRSGAQQMCFGNAIVVAVVYGLRYVEGYAMVPPRANPEIPIVHHAWNVDVAGRLVDPTWLNTGVAYRGVEFRVERADDATWNGDASILDDFRRGHPLFRQPWQGEDWAAEWPWSDRLELMRDNARAIQEL